MFTSWFLFSLNGKPACYSILSYQFVEFCFRYYIKAAHTADYTKSHTKKVFYFLYNSRIVLSKNSLNVKTFFIKNGITVSYLVAIEPPNSIRVVNANIQKYFIIINTFSIF